MNIKDYIINLKCMRLSDLGYVYIEGYKIIIVILENLYDVNYKLIHIKNTDIYFIKVNYKDKKFLKSLLNYIYIY